MALGTYTELKASIASWMARASLPSGIEDDLIEMAEAEFNRLIRNQDLKASATFDTVAGTETATLPVDQKLIVSISHTDDIKPRLLVMRSEAEIIDLNAGSVTGRPTYWARGDGLRGVRLSRIPDAVYTLNCIYYKSIAGLSGSNATNWLLDRHPDIYLLTCLKKACVRFVDLKRQELIMNELNPLMADFLKEIEEEKLALNGSGQIQVKGGIA